jgi:hypothetical protein
MRLLSLVFVSFDLNDCDLKFFGIFLKSEHFIRLNRVPRSGLGKVSKMQYFIRQKLSQS